VIKTVRGALSLLSKKERKKYFWLVSLRSLVSIIDLVGILAIGFLAASVALFVANGSDSDRVLSLGGLSIPALTAKTLPAASVVILLLFLAKAGFSILLTRILARFLAIIEANIARSVAKATFGKTMSETRRYSTEETYFAVQIGSPTTTNTLLNSLGTLLAESVLFFLVLVTFFIVDPISALGAIGYILIVAFLTQYFIGNIMQNLSIKINSGAVETGAVISDLNSVVREATILSKKDYFLDKLKKIRLSMASSSADQYVLGGLPRYIVETALVIAVALFVLLQAGRGDLVAAAGTIGVFLSGGLRLTASLLPLQGALMSIKQSIPAAVTTLNILEKAGSRGADAVATNSPSGAKSPEGLGVKLDDVNFGYVGAQPTLKNLSFTVHPGEQVAIIGPSGSGKSTAADLILGLLTPMSGTATIDNTEPSQFVKTHPGLVAYVPQEPAMVGGTILENIALGCDVNSLDMDRVHRAVNAAHLDLVIDELPDGLNTDIGKRKDQLSGGQLQRIGLARALYSEPRLLILDEATSALDASSEDAIKNTLDDLRGSVTVILIAHRLHTVQHADRVFLLEGGELLDTGTFKEVLARNQTVKSMAELMKLGED
jgi:ABC-type multidrug transport system fused ATPase/permease subunit